MELGSSSFALSIPVFDELRRRSASTSPARETTINVVSWIFLALVVSTLITRFAVKLSRRTSKRVVQLDDGFLLLAALFSFGQTLAITMQWRKVAGEHLTDLSPSAQGVYQKAAYASSMLFVANMGCAKISMALVMQKLFIGRVFEYTSYILALFTAGWTVSGVIVIAFQCHLPTPWDLSRTSECIDTVAFGNYLAATNIMTEVLLVLVPLAVWTQKSPVGNRLYVSAAFWSRLSIVGAVSAQLYFFNASSTSSSLTDSWATTICMQIAQTLSVISACLPGLHPLVAKDMSETSSTHTAQNDDGSRWDAKRFGSVSTHISKPSVDSKASRDLHMTFGPLEAPYCHPLATHGLTRSSPSCDSYNFPRMTSNLTAPLSPLKPPQNVFNRLVRSSSSLELDPVGSSARNVDELGCLPAPDWEEAENGDNEESDERRPTSEYVFERSKVVSMPEERTMFEIGKEWTGFVPPLPTPKILANPPRAF